MVISPRWADEAKIFHWSHLRASIWAFVLENSLSFHIIWPLFHEHTDPTYFMFILLLSHHIPPQPNIWKMVHASPYSTWQMFCQELLLFGECPPIQANPESLINRKFLISSNFLQVSEPQPIMIALETLQVYSSANLWGNDYSSKGQINTRIRTNLLSLMKLRWGVMEKSNIILMRN